MRLMLPLVCDDDDSLLPLFSSLVSSLRELIEIIWSIFYVSINPHMVESVPLHEHIEAYRREALETQMRLSLMETSLTQSISKKDDFLVDNCDHILIIKIKGSSHRATFANIMA